MTDPPVLLALALLATPGLAQSGASGARDTFSTARSLSSAGGGAESATYRVESSLAQPIHGPEQSSTSYSFRGGVAWVSESFAPSGPVVFGAEVGRGDKVAGYAETIFGRNFAEPSGGALSVTIGGQQATALTIGTGNDLELIVPAGIDSFGNGLGRVDIEASNANGSRAARGAFVYTPALLGTTTPAIGTQFTLQEYAGAAEFQGLYYGFSIPGVGLPFSSLGGQFRLLGSFTPFGGGVISTDDSTPWNLAIPAQPSLVGQPLELQAYTLDGFAPLSGSFTNVHTIFIQG